MSELFDHPDNAGPECPTMFRQIRRHLREIEAQADKLHQHDPYVVGAINQLLLAIDDLLDSIA